MRSNLCVKAQIATAVCLRSDQWKWNDVHKLCVRAQIATALYGSLCLRSDQWRWIIALEQCSQPGNLCLYQITVAQVTQ